MTFSGRTFLVRIASCLANVILQRTAVMVSFVSFSVSYVIIITPLTEQSRDALRNCWRT